MRTGRKVTLAAALFLTLIFGSSIAFAAVQYDVRAAVLTIIITTGVVAVAIAMYLYPAAMERIFSYVFGVAFFVVAAKLVLYVLLSNEPEPTQWRRTIAATPLVIV